MKIFLMDNKRITKYNLPNKISEDYLINYLADYSSQANTITIEVADGRWRLRSNGNADIVSGNQMIEDAILDDYSYYYLKLLGSKNFIILFSMPSQENQMSTFTYSNMNEITIGSNSKSNICYNNDLTNDIHASISLENNVWVIRNKENNKTPIFINNKAVTVARLRYGDTIFINGLRIVWMKDFIKVNNPNNAVTISGLSTYQNNLTQNNNDLQEVSDEDNNTDLYSLDDYFYHIPRIKETIEHKEIVIDSPPNNQVKEDVPFWLTLGSSFTMLASSFVMFFNVYNNLSAGKTVLSCLPQIIMLVAMLVGSVIIPRLLKAYQKKMSKKREALRQEKYKDYLNQKEEEIKQEMKRQASILNDNNEHPIKCYEKIMSHGRNLWNREILDDDFLTVRLGLGTVDTDMTVRAPEEHFSLDKDNLFDSVYKVVEETKKIPNVPITYSFLNNSLTSMIFNCSYKYDYLNAIITQIVSFQSASDLKIAILTNKKNADYWDYAKILPHCWNDSRTVRYFSTNIEELNEVSNDLDNILKERKEAIQGANDSDSKSGYRNFSTYYLILTDDYLNVKNCQFILDLLKENGNLGFSLVAIADSMKNLPNRCEKFIQISEQNSCILSKELNTQTQIQFTNEHVKDLDMEALSTTLANIPIMAKDGMTSLPQSLSFLEMFNVSKIEQLNILNRWQVNNPVISLATTIGVHSNLEPFKLDLHEKFHGPHGLIAGSTGSGKSEFIITYILSMALNYHPYEVQFVLIDYKGGGLAGAFENKETGVKLPHLIGTITNLDTSEMNRTLVSIESELKRRQKIFNTTRDSLGESTIDIYKYQRLYREGIVKEPMAHLFIISDEFAELKSQQPEFMNQLISTARIGRSLGVHLILATQKPSGVVNDQIWSNSKFKVCLKVQDRSDSMEMLKRPEAASIKETGRFYLQVGYDDYFDIGQSGWSGAKYIPSNKILKKVDDSISFVNNVGYVVKSINNNVKKEVTKDLGEQLTNTVKYIYNLAKGENISVNSLWLPVMPPVIYLYDLKDKYNYQPEPFVIEPIIGELDDARNQRQDILTLPISKTGNTLIYGMAGSGKENALNTIISSTVAFHSPDEINFYILDFGSETLKMFRDTPQVGDVCTIENPEKIENLFKMLKEEINIRKDLFIDFNGDMSIYNKKSGKTVPNIVIVINNYEVFMENYQFVEEDLIILTREGIKYGIYFILSVSGVNSIRYKLSQNFANMLVLQLVNDSDYQSLLGNTGKLYPARIFGRGIIKTDNFYEFQTACLTDPENMLDQIKIMNQKLAGMYPQTARRIPVLPNIVSVDFIKPYINELTKIPIGVEKDSLAISTFDFVNNDITIVGTNDIYQIKRFVLGLSKTIANVPNVSVIFVDLIDMFNTIDNQNNLVYINNNLNELVDKIEQDVNSKIAIKDNMLNVNRTVLILNGISTLNTKITPENYKKFTGMLEKIRTIKTFSAIIIDNIMNLKRIEYDPWFKSNIDQSNGIYLGSGITDQYSIKITKNTKEMRQEIPFTFGYCVKRGIPTLIKVVEDEIEE